MDDGGFLATLKTDSPPPLFLSLQHTVIPKERSE
jgi:hypothetical protein